MLGFGQDPNEQRHETAGPGSSSAIESSFLMRLRERDSLAWSDLVHLYYPLIHRWCSRAQVPSDEIADVVQEVFRAVSTAIVRFDPNRKDASLRGWMFGITQRQLMAYRRNARKQPDGEGGTEALLRIQQVTDDDCESSMITEPVADRILVVRSALERLRSQIEPKTFSAFWQLMVDGKTPAEVADALQMKVATVYVIKGRLMRRLRDLLEGEL